MKHLAIIISLLLFCGTMHAQYKSAEIIMKDGSKREGMAKIPDFADKNINFKATESDKAQSIKSQDIRTLIFKDAEGPLEMEYYNCRMNETIAIVTQWGWLTVVSRGAVSTYEGALPSPAGSTYSGPADNPYCYREGEKYATKIPAIGFATKMAKYFEDYPKLSTKIKEKTDGYRYEDIDAIIAEYNEWKLIILRNNSIDIFIPVSICLFLDFG